MPAFVILAAMKGRFISDRGNYYDNFQMIGHHGDYDRVYIDALRRRYEPSETRQERQ